MAETCSSLVQYIQNILKLVGSKNLFLPHYWYLLNL